MFRTDTDIERDVLTELKWTPSLKNDDIAVGVREGVVTLGGFVGSYVDKFTAERTASKVKGVRAIANDIEVKPASGSTRTDPDLAHAAVSALAWNFSVPQERVKVKVEKGWLTLEGDVDWYYQKEAAERAVHYLPGIKGISNLISVKARAIPTDVKEKIKGALQRGATFDAEHITVHVDGNKVTLRGTVRSYAEFRDAERAARNAPGVTEVFNQLTVDPMVMATA